MRLLIIPAAAITFLSCQPRQTQTTPGNDTLQTVYIALLEAQEQRRTIPQDTSRHFPADSILGAYGMTKQEFRAGIAEYQADPAKWQKFLQSVTKRMEEQAAGKDQPKRSL